MPAGADLERSIKDGMECSRAAAFFVTPHFTDKDWFASEVDYATNEKRNKGDKFAITPPLMTSKDGRRGTILDMFEHYVHDVKHHQMVKELLMALPIRMDRGVWKGECGVVGKLRRYEAIRNIATGLTRSTSRDFV